MTLRKWPPPSSAWLPFDSINSTSVWWVTFFVSWIGGGDGGGGGVPDFVWWMTWEVTLSNEGDGGGDGDGDGGGGGSGGGRGGGRDGASPDSSLLSECSLSSFCPPSPSGLSTGWYIMPWEPLWVKVAPPAWSESATVYSEKSCSRFLQQQH